MLRARPSRAMLDFVRSTAVARRLSAMSQDTALLLALALIGAGPLLATVVGMPAEGQIVLICAGSLFMAHAIRLITPLALWPLRSSGSRWLRSSSHRGTRPS